MADTQDPSSQDETGQSTSPNPGGRPTKYRAIYAKQAAQLCALGAIDMDLARFFEVHRDTIYAWKARHPKFSDAIKTPGDVANDRVERRLYERAMGYEACETDIRVVDGKIVKTEIIRAYPPDTAAAFIWLKNRRPQQWRDRHEMRVDGSMTLVQVAGADADV